MIIDETYKLIQEKYGDYLKNLEISDFRMGSYMAAVKLSDNTYGIASIDSDSEIHCDKKNRDFGEFTPLKIQGRKVTDLFENQKQSSLIKSLKIAVLNAISSRIIELHGYKVLRNADPIDLIDLNQKLTITLVGAFHSYIKKILKSGNKLYVLELNENALLPEHKQFYVPANDFRRVFPISEIVIITGLTLVNNTLDELLTSIQPNTQVIVTGPSSSIIPDVLFNYNVSIIGGTSITKPELLFPLISQGAAGYHLFEYCAEKVCILNEK
jgi:uncharacterized protein (DUF4213/DUF364 family)